MRHPGSALCLVLVFACWTEAPAAQPVAPAPVVDLMISSGDSWWMGDWLPVDSPGSIHESTQLWSDLLHIRRIYWRGQQEEMMIDYGLIRPDNLEFHEFIAGWENHLIKDLHLNQIAVDEAHGRGMEVYFLAPLFDFCGPADSGGCKEYPYFSQINFTLEHPEWMPIDRYGVRRQNGPIEFCYPGARRAVIDLYLHYLDRDHLDGINFFTYCENYSLRSEDEFGFNQPIVDEYRRRYGVDIRVQPFDVNLWRYLRGEYVTQFLRELKAELIKRGKKLSVMINPRDTHRVEPWNVPQYVLTSGSMYLDWERWVREGLVDELVAAGNVPEVMRESAIATMMTATRGTAVSVSTVTARPFAPDMRAYGQAGVSSMLFATNDASYVKLVYPEQGESCLQGSDIYAQMRYLAQVSDGQAHPAVASILPLARSEHLLLRRAALTALGRLGGPSAISALEEGLNDLERGVRVTAAFALVKAHGPNSLARLIATVRRVREFQLFQAVATTLAAIDASYLPEIQSLARDPDVLLRRLAIFALGRRPERAALEELLGGLRDSDLLVRFYAARSLQAYGARPEAVAGLLAALSDPSPVIQDRAALSLAIAVVPGSTTHPRLGLESSVGILRTDIGPLPERTLTAQQERALSALVKRFREFGQGSTRTDLDWGFRPVGNSILAFGAEGARRLQQCIDQRGDKALSALAWKVLYLREGMENFCLVPDRADQDDKLYRTYPTPLAVFQEKPLVPPAYDPTAK